MKRLFFAVLTTSALMCLHPDYVSAYTESDTKTAPEPASPGEILTPSEQKPIEIWTFPSAHRLITGKALILTVQVIWRLGINVQLDDLAGVDLSPFIVDHVSIGERQIFDNERDFRVVQYILSLPEDSKEGKYTVPSFGIPFVDEVEQKEGLATSSPISVKKVPVVITGNVDRDVIDIGDVIHYNITILHEEDTEILLKNLKEVDFKPFVLLHSTFQHGKASRLRKLTIDYYLSIYEMGGPKRKYEIPSLSVFHYKPDQHKGGKGGMIETTEVRTQPIPVAVNKLLKTVDIPLEGQKGPMLYKRSELYFQGYFVFFLGASLLVLLVAPMGLRRVRDSLFPPVEEPSRAPELAADELLSLLSSLRFTGEGAQDRKHLEGIDKALRTYLGSLSDLPADRALAITTSEMLTRVPPELVLPSKEILRGLDVMLFGEKIEKNTAEELITRIEKMLRPAEENT